VLTGSSSLVLDVWREFGLDNCVYLFQEMIECDDELQAAELRADVLKDRTQPSSWLLRARMQRDGLALDPSASGEEHIVYAYLKNTEVAHLRKDPRADARKVIA
jgi:hypothetical protein